jgi:hypothetical protein
MYHLLLFAGMAVYPIHERAMGIQLRNLRPCTFLVFLPHLTTELQPTAAHYLALHIPSTSSPEVG